MDMAALYRQALHPHHARRALPPDYSQLAGNLPISSVFTPHLLGQDSAHRPGVYYRAYLWPRFLERIALQRVSSIMEA